MNAECEACKIFPQARCWQHGQWDSPEASAA